VFAISLENVGNDLVQDGLTSISRRSNRVDNMIQTVIPSSALVTGADGFVGSHLSRLLEERGWRVAAVSRRAHDRSTLPGINRVCLPLSADIAGWQNALSSVQCVVHLAAHVHQLRATGSVASVFREVNVNGSRFVAEQAARAGVRRFIFLSSIKVNGEGGSARPYRADDEPRPQDAYAESKLEAELVLHDVCNRAGMELTIVRPPLVYGPGVRANFRRLLHLAALGIPLPFRSIDNRRSLIGIWNLADFIEICMKHPYAAGKTWLISDGEDLSTPSLITKLALLMRGRASLFSVSPRMLRRLAAIVGLGGEMSRLCDSLQMDVMPAREELHWRVPLGVDEGLALTVAAYLAARRQ
jgi:nucleoside-diphosphate-sugar epimerase